MNYLPLKKGKVIFNSVTPYWEKGKHQFSYTTFIGGDVVSGDYHIRNNDASNFIDITKLDLKTGDIEGNFQATVFVHLMMVHPISGIP